MVVVNTIAAFIIDTGISIVDEEVVCDFDTNGYRLPTSAEWEFAARCGEDTLYAGSDTASDVGWHGGNAEYDYTQQVATLQPNACGFYGPQINNGMCEDGGIFSESATCAFGRRREGSTRAWAYGHGTPPPPRSAKGARPEQQERVGRHLVSVETACASAPPTADAGPRGDRAPEPSSPCCCR